MNEMNDTVGAPIFNIPQEGAQVAGADMDEAFAAALSARILMLTAEAFSSQRPALVAKVDGNLLDVVCLTTDGMAQTFRFDIRPGPAEVIEKEIITAIFEIAEATNSVTDMAINQVLCGFGSPSLLLG
jgi:hypothetical protein